MHLAPMLFLREEGDLDLFHTKSINSLLKHCEIWKHGQLNTKNCSDPSEMIETRSCSECKKLLEIQEVAKKLRPTCGKLQSKLTRAEQ